MGMLVRKLVATGAAAAAAVAARRGVEFGWRFVRQDEPPTAGDVSDDTSLRDLLLWSGLVAGAVVVARRIALRATDDLLGSDEE